uniref:PH domain-containing protein n=1 Tax=Trichuris muris TaxID=70415 RepID=A0A5S6QTZ2_TRIMR
MTTLSASRLDGQVLNGCSVDRQGCCCFTGVLAVQGNQPSPFNRQLRRQVMLQRSERRASSCCEDVFSDDGELDSDAEAELDPDAQLGRWLDQLQVLSDGLAGVCSNTAGSMNSTLSAPRVLDAKVRPHSPKKPASASSRVLDSYRYSEANLEESADVDLDALIGELCALESQLNATDSGGSSMLAVGRSQQAYGCHRFSRVGNGEATHGGRSLPTSACGQEPHHQQQQQQSRCRSPDTDSAYCETMSMLSESTQSSGNRSGESGGSSIDSTRDSMTTPSPTQLMEAVQAKIRNVKEEIQRENLTEAEMMARLKNEKIKIALEKMKEASVKKLYVKVFTLDGRSKNILIDERWTVAYVVRQLAEKYQVLPTHRLAIVEFYPDLYMERIYEDHELIVENILMWTENSPNRLLFTERPDKYDMFSCPESYLLDHTHSDRNSVFGLDARQQLLEEFFTPSRVQPPELEGPLYLKSDGKKSWKKYLFVLRGSGLYYVPKGKSKSSRDLTCLMNFDVVQVYGAIGWKKKYKAPTSYGFALKHPQIQVKASKYIKYLCAEDEKTCQRWIACIRIAKNGRQLLENYERSSTAVEEDRQAKLNLSRVGSTERFNGLPHHRQEQLQSELHNILVTDDLPCGGAAADTNGLNGLGVRGRPKNDMRREQLNRNSKTLTPVDAPTISTKDEMRVSVSQCCSPALIPKACSVSDARSVCSSTDSTDRVDQLSLNAFESDSCTGTIKRQPSKNCAGAKGAGTDVTRQPMPLAFVGRKESLLNKQAPVMSPDKVIQPQQSMVDLTISCDASAAEEENDSDEELPPAPPPYAHFLQHSASKESGDEFPPPPSPVCFLADTQLLTSASDNYGLLCREREVPVGASLGECAPVFQTAKAGPSAATNGSRSGKLPPPPPPKRSETTRLSCAIPPGIACNGRPTIPAKPKPTVQAKVDADHLSSENAVDNFHAELQMAMQKRLRRLEGSERQS